MEYRRFWSGVGAYEGKHGKVDEQKSEVVNHDLFLDLDFRSLLTFC